MSRLGIAFVLPYVGSNGIKVVNNVIEIDPAATITVNEIDAANVTAGGLNVNDTILVGSTPPLVQIQSNNITMYDEDNSTVITLDDSGLVDCQKIRTNLNNDDSPELVFLHLDNANNLALTINGTNGNSLQVVPTV